MNDFTKEELHMLLGGISLCFEELILFDDEPDNYRNIYNKIQSMIDNYCTPKYYNPDCYCGQQSSDGTFIEDCGYPPHMKISDNK